MLLKILILIGLFDIQTKTITEYKGLKKNKNFYEILEVSKNATDQEIKKLIESLCYNIIQIKI